MNKDRREKYIREGKCANCGRPGVISKVLCQICIDKLKQNYIDRVQYKKNNGICIQCNSIVEVGKASCTEHLKLNRERSLAFKNKDIATQRAKTRARYHKRNKHYKEKRKRYTQQLRASVLEAYGNICVYCGQDNPLVLQIDHIYNDGYKERKTNGSWNIYQKLKNLGYPKDRYQLLCANCNWCKGIYGVYPDGTKA